MIIFRYTQTNRQSLHHNIFITRPKHSDAQYQYKREISILLVVLIHGLTGEGGGGRGGLKWKLNFNWKPVSPNDKYS